MKEMPQSSEYSNPRLERIIRSLAGLHGTSLRQDTEDTEQLKPVERLRSIEKVWLLTRSKLGNPKTAIDAGSGFGYGTVFLETVGTRTIGVEKVGHKVDQAIQLFDNVGIPIRRTSTINFSETPAFMATDFTALPEDAEKADLITMFYLSGEMALNPAIIEKSRHLLNHGGRLMLSTEVAKEEVARVLQTHPIQSAQVTLLEIPNNFERTVILVEFK